ncbi:MAG: DMT family transporter [Proteobacteria bacterium]|nr:DMT family transporter [Pseudomonadota bacterium]MBI3495761.1 DMT family transporter [Pseudomonadota bacterium]
MPLFPASSTGHDRPLIAIAYMLAAVLFFTAQSGLTKWLVASIPVNEIVFFRHAFALVPAFWMLGKSGGIASLKTRRIGMHLFRLAGGMSSMTLGFLALALIPVADVTAYSFAAPLLITALSVPLLGEQVGPHRWSAVVAGFIGVLIMVRPGTGAIQPGALVALAATLGSAVVALTMRQLGHTETTASIVVTYSGLAGIVSGLTLPFWWVTPNWLELAALAILGLGGGAAQYWYTKALNLAPVSVISPLNYTGLIWAVLMGYVFWGEVPEQSTLVGALIIVASSLYILYRETVRRAERARAPR